MTDGTPEPDTTPEPREVTIGGYPSMPAPAPPEDEGARLVREMRDFARDFERMDSSWADRLAALLAQKDAEIAECTQAILHVERGLRAEITNVTDCMERQAAAIRNADKKIIDLLVSNESLRAERMKLADKLERRVPALLEVAREIEEETGFAHLAARIREIVAGEK